MTITITELDGPALNAGHRCEHYMDLGQCTNGARFLFKLGTTGVNPTEALCVPHCLLRTVETFTS
jgi:hypothetical protein